MKILAALRQEETKLENQLGKIRAAITCLNGNGAHHKLSAAVRRNMSRAQKLRWKSSPKKQAAR